ncbi:SEC-C metal-binding domain-containing protein [Bacillus sp. JJ1609]|uniref:YecA family protein n=1 Tax=Bacillus sp. JJ1609 TaxID=3122977 RepID=UPI002FFEE2B2
MNFLEKIEPHLLSDDLLVQEFVMHALMEYPNIPEDWTVRLLKEAIAKKEKEITILANIDRFPFNSEAIEVLLKGAEEADPDDQFLYARLIRNILSDLKLKHRTQLENFLPEKEFEYIQFLMDGEEEQVWEEYGSVLAALETDESFNQDLYSKAKEIAGIMVKRGFIEEHEIKYTFNEQEDKKFFQFNGILAVYMAGLMNQEQYIPYFAGLLDRDDDLLLEEISDTLSLFQSDAVVEHVASMINNDSMSIYPISILGNTKTASSIEKLKSLYSLIDDEENKVSIVEALCHQLTEEGLPVVEDAVKAGYYSSILESERILYGFYKVMGIDHLKLGEWKRLAIQRDEDYLNRKKELEAQEFPLMQTQPVKAEPKVGRNDPCPCGSGKKYKKCCGK